MIVEVQQVANRIQRGAPGGFTDTVQMLSDSGLPEDPSCEVVLIVAGADLGKYRSGQRYQLTLTPVDDRPAV